MSVSKVWVFYIVCKKCFAQIFLPASKVRHQITEVIDEFFNSSCIHFKERELEDEYYIRIFSGTGCYAHVGRQPKTPNDVKILGGNIVKIFVIIFFQISLAPGCGCKKGVVIHEFLHALGFLHEQSRPDRDDHVTIHFENIRRGKNEIVK